MCNLEPAVRDAHPVPEHCVVALPCQSFYGSSRQRTDVQLRLVSCPSACLRESMITRVHVDQESVPKSARDWLVQVIQPALTLPTLLSPTVRGNHARSTSADNTTTKSAEVSQCELLTAP